MHRLEKIWLIIGTVGLGVFLSILGVSAFTHDNTPSGGETQIAAKDIGEGKKFEPGVFPQSDGKIVVQVVAKAFAYEPQKIEVPVGKEIVFKVATTDVIHSFSIIDTNVNMEIIPGFINQKNYTFKEPGNYLVLCNEYCGIGHQYMKFEIEVTENE